MILTPGVGPDRHCSAADGPAPVQAVRFEAPAGARSEASIPYLRLQDHPRLHVIATGDHLRAILHPDPAPELEPAGDWPRTFIAVELLLSDGSRLSDHEPRDQYGALATARGQGEAKILRAGAWNEIQVDLTACAGRTILDVLLVSDPPSALGSERRPAETEDAAASDEPAPSGGPLAGWVLPPTVGPLPQDPPLDDLVSWVDTRRGTALDAELARGGMLPATALPNAFHQLAPLMSARDLLQPYAYRVHADPADRPRLQGVGITHQPSPGMPDRHRVVLMPLATALPEGDPDRRARAFDHAQEIARPDVYTTVLEGGVDLAMAPTEHGMILEVRFPPEAPGAHLLIEGVDDEARFDLAGAVFDGTLTGWVDDVIRGPGGAPVPSRMFLAGSVDPLPANAGPADGTLASARVLTFAPGTRTVTLRLATSLIGTDQARRALDQELAHRSLDDVQRAARAAWEERLGVVQVEGAAAPQRRTLCGSLYRLSLSPAIGHENVGTPEQPVLMHASPVLPPLGDPSDTETGAAVLPGPFTTDHAPAHAQRTVWPAYALLYPAIAAELLDGIVQQHRDGGWTARWAAPGYDAAAAHGGAGPSTGSDVVLADAQARGVVLRDPVAAYEAGLRNATAASDSPQAGRAGMDTSIFTGFVDASVPGSVMWTLEGMIGDAALAVQADALARDAAQDPHDRRRYAEEAEYLRSRSLGAGRLFDADTGFFRARGRDGAFSGRAEDFDPFAWGGAYGEANAWGLRFRVPHDGEGLLALLGGPEALLEALEEAVSLPETGRLADDAAEDPRLQREQAVQARLGQLAPASPASLHLPLAFHYADAPDRAGEIIREVQRRLFTGEQVGGGLPGADLSGALSAWWVLAALGLHAAQPASERLFLSAPLFEAAHVAPLGGMPFTIRTRGGGDGATGILSVRREDPWGAAAWTDGEQQAEELDVRSLLASDLRGEILVELGPGPAPAGQPIPPLVPGGSEARLLRDQLPVAVRSEVPRPDRRPRPAATADLSALTDDDSRTEVLLAPAADGRIVLDLPPLQAPRRIRFYTLTSSADPGVDPADWQLEATSASGGDEWIVVDERAGEVFPWRRQTRPFRIEDPQEHTRFRLIIDSPWQAVGLAEIELLAHEETVEDVAWEEPAPQPSETADRAPERSEDEPGASPTSLPSFAEDFED